MPVSAYLFLCRCHIGFWIRALERSLDYGRAIFFSADIVASAKQMIVRCFSCAHQQTFDVNILGTCRNRIFVINSESDTIFVGKISDIALTVAVAVDGWGLLPVLAK